MKPDAPEALVKDELDAIAAAWRMSALPADASYEEVQPVRRCARC